MKLYYAAYIKCDEEVLMDIFDLNTSLIIVKIVQILLIRFHFSN